jgi:hypothetical protein
LHERLRYFLRVGDGAVDYDEFVHGILGIPLGGHNTSGAQVRKPPCRPGSWAKRQPFIAVFPPGCVGQLASFGPTWHLSRSDQGADGEEHGRIMAGKRAGAKVRRGPGVPQGQGVQLELSWA